MAMTVSKHCNLSKQKGSCQIFYFSKLLLNGWDVPYREIIFEKQFSLPPQKKSVIRKNFKGKNYFTLTTRDVLIMQHLYTVLHFL